MLEERSTGWHCTIRGSGETDNAGQPTPTPGSDQLIGRHSGTSCCCSCDNSSRTARHTTRWSDVATQPASRHYTVQITTGARTAASPALTHWHCTQGRWLRYLHGHGLLAHLSPHIPSRATTSLIACPVMLARSLCRPARYVGAVWTREVTQHHQQLWMWCDDCILYMRHRRISFSTLFSRPY